VSSFGGLLMSINRFVVVLPVLAGLVLTGSAIARMMPAQTVRDTVYQTCRHNGVHFNKQGHPTCGLHRGWSDEGTGDSQGGGQPGDDPTGDDQGGAQAAGDSGQEHGRGRDEHAAQHGRHAHGANSAHGRSSHAAHGREGSHGHHADAASGHGGSRHGGHGAGRGHSKG
jgi:hypothetical protein